jgi:hypothetical protein
LELQASISFFLRRLFLDLYLLEVLFSLALCLRESLVSLHELPVCLLDSLERLLPLLIVL